MECRNQQVVHKRFGQGSVQSIDGNVVHIYFQQYGARAFRYPEAFETFLRAEDADFDTAVQADLEKWRGEQAQKDAALKMKVEAEIGEARMAGRRTTARPAAAKSTASRRTTGKKAAVDKK